MKYLISFTFILMISFSASAQRSFQFKTEIQTSQINEMMSSGLGLGVIYKSKWLIQYDLESSSQKAPNAPKDYSGPINLIEKYNFHSINVGKVFALNPKKSVRFTTKLGLHTASYKGYDDFVRNPPLDDLTVGEALSSGWGAFILLPIALTDHQSYQSHDYKFVKENLLGLNGEFILDYHFTKCMYVSAGGKWFLNKRVKKMGPTFKLGVQF